MSIRSTRFARFVAVSLLTLLVLPACHKPPPPEDAEAVVRQLARLLDSSELRASEFLTQAEREGKSAESVLAAVEETGPAARSSVADYQQGLAEVVQRAESEQRLADIVEDIEHDVFCSLLNQYLASGESIDDQDITDAIGHAVTDRLAAYLIGPDYIDFMEATVRNPLIELSDSPDPWVQAQQISFDVCSAF